MIKRVVVSIVCGLLCVLFYQEQDTWIHIYIAKKCTDFCTQVLRCSITFDHVEYSVSTPSLHFHAITISSLDNTWSWQCNSLRVKSSWWDAWEQKQFPLTICIDGGQLKTLCEGKTCAFVEYAQDILQDNSGIPITLHSM